MFSTMFEPHRRNSGAKALFNAFALLVGSSSIAFWFSELPARIKVVSGVILMVVFSAAWLICPPKPSKAEGDEDLDD